MNTNNLEAAVIRILHDIARPRKELTKSTRIYEDLLIAGDDAVELLEKMQAECGTSFRGFRFDEYFPNETEALFCRIMLLFKRSSKRTITVQHLIDVAQRGVWFDENSKGN